ncbi:MAG: hypothetical protein ACHQUC_05850 [Chlamydiales bacterium]
MMSSSSSSPPPFSHSPQTESQPIELALAKELIGKIEAHTVQRVRQGGLTRSQQDDVFKRLEQMAKEGTTQFGKTPDLSNPEVQEFTRQKMLGLITTTIGIIENQPLDLIREADLSEAVFSHKEDYRPIIATDALATCIGVAGYDPVNQFGFVVHFTGEDEVEASGAILLDRVRAYRTKNDAAPLLIHLRGGIKEMSEPLLEKIKEWLKSSGLMTIIASEDTLQAPIIPGTGFPKVPASIKLDVRTGTCEPYDWMTNPYSEREQKEMGEVKLADLMIEIASKNPKIRIVYDPISSPELKSPL